MDDWLEVEGEVKNQCFFWPQELSIFFDCSLCHFNFRVFAMKRNKIIQSNNQDKQIEHKRRIASMKLGMRRLFI